MVYLSYYNSPQLWDTRNHACLVFRFILTAFQGLERGSMQVFVEWWKNAHTPWSIPQHPTSPLLPTRSRIVAVWLVLSGRDWECLLQGNWLAPEERLRCWSYEAPQQIAQTDHSAVKLQVNRSHPHAQTFQLVFCFSFLNMSRQSRWRPIQINKQKKKTTWRKQIMQRKISTKTIKQHSQR